MREAMKRIGERHLSAFSGWGGTRERQSRVFVCVHHIQKKKKSTTVIKLSRLLYHTDSTICVTSVER